MKIKIILKDDSVLSIPLAAFCGVITDLALAISDEHPEDAEKLQAVTPILHEHLKGRARDH